MGWYLWVKADGGTSGDALLAAASWPLALGATALVILYVLARAFAHSTVYTLTNRRIVLRFGVAIPMMINLPLEKIESAALAEYGEVGDIALTLAPGERVSYLALWPHVRPWHFGVVKPMLRGLPDARLAAALLADAVERGSPRVVLGSPQHAGSSAAEPSDPLVGGRSLAT
jgi:hypothetical protein